jgi:hypothetical protein
MGITATTSPRPGHKRRKIMDLKNIPYDTAYPMPDYMDHINNGVHVVYETDHSRKIEPYTGDMDSIDALEILHEHRDMIEIDLEATSGETSWVFVVQVRGATFTLVDKAGCRIA